MGIGSVRVGFSNVFSRFHYHNSPCQYDSNKCQKNKSSFLYLLHTKPSPLLFDYFNVIIFYYQLSLHYLECLFQELLYPFSIDKSIINRIFIPKYIIKITFYIYKYGIDLSFAPIFIRICMPKNLFLMVLPSISQNI